MAPVVVLLNKPRYRKRIAAFDYDWTLVKPLDGRTHAKDVNDRQWLREAVPSVLAEYYEKGYGLYVFTNQTHAWKADAIKAQLEPLGLPMTIAIGMDKHDKKPATTLWDVTIGERAWDVAHSFYVGDAAGRPGDWSDSDKAFADKIGVTFKTPEELFPPQVVARAAASVVAPRAEPEVVIMVGFPASGKSTVAEEQLVSASGGRYVRIDGDALKTAARMVREATAAIADGKSVVFDATNGTRERRQAFIDVAKKFGMLARCVVMQVSIDEAMENAKAREAAGGSHIPNIAFYTFRKRYEEPSAEECEVIKVGTA